MVAWTLLPVEGQPKELQGVESVEHALRGAAAHLRTRSASGAKDRVDLAALKRHTGTTYVQVETVPDGVFHRLRAQLHGVLPLVLLPPGTPAGADGICLLADAYAGLKGLPPNPRATMLLSACGLKARHGDVRGDCFLGHCSLDAKAAAPTLALGGDFAPPKIAQRDWLEAAQKGHAGGASAAASALESALAARLDAMRREDVAQAVAAKTATPAANAQAANPPLAESAAAPASAAPAVDVSEAAASTGGDVSVGASAGARMTWTNGDDEVTVYVRGLPRGTKAKDVKVEVKEEHLRMEVRTLPAAEAVLLNGTLFQVVNPADCTWCLEDAKGGERMLVLTLEKKIKMTWLMVVHGTELEKEGGELV
jgi:hypothetical protein